MVMVAPISGPNVQSSASRGGQAPESRVVVKQSLATTMPSDRQTSIGILNVEANKASTGDYDQWKRSRVFNPKQAGIAITSENFLKAKAGFEPLFMHNIAATKLALMSVMDKEKPRYSEKVNILA